VIHISHWGDWSFVWGDKATISPRGNRTGYKQPSISKTVLPNHARWDISLVNFQQWLQRFTFDGNCAEQLYSVQPLPSCTSISINAFYNKSLNRKSYLNISFTLALGFQAKVLAQGRRNSGRGVVKELRAMQAYKKQKIVTNYVCFCSATMLTSRLITEIIENHSEVSGCANSCNKFVSKSILINHEITSDTLWKGTSSSSLPPWKGHGGQCPNHVPILRCPCSFLKFIKIRATLFLSFSCWNEFFYDCQYWVYRWRKETFTKLALPIGWLWFTLIEVKTDNLGSKLPTQAHQLHYRASRTLFSDTITSWDAEKQPLYWNWATLPLQSYSLQPPKINVDKPI